MVGFMNPDIAYDADVVRDQISSEEYIKFSIPLIQKSEEAGKITINPWWIRIWIYYTLEAQIRGQWKTASMIDFNESKWQKASISRYGNDYIATLCMKL